MEAGTEVHPILEPTRLDATCYARSTAANARGRGLMSRAAPPSVFLSYRRRGGADMARLVRAALERRGYRVFLDVEDLSSGRFRAELLRTIEAATDVLVLLSPGSLDACDHPDDWFRLEIGHALETRRNVVPVLAEDFQWPQRELSEPVRDLLELQQAQLSHRLFDASIERLTRLMRSRRRRSALPIMLFAAAIAVLALVGSRLLSLDDARNVTTSSNQVGAFVGAAPLEGGRLAIRTERFQLEREDGPHVQRSIRVSEGAPAAELAFVLRNDGAEAVRIGSLQVIELGVVRIQEDYTEPTLVSAGSQYRMDIASTPRVDLGTLVFTGPQGERRGVATSGNLLAPDLSHKLPQGEEQAFLVRVRCDSRSRTIEFVHESRIIARRLEGLDWSHPQIVDGCHVFVIAADCIAAHGERHRLYSDWIYTVWPTPVSPAQPRILGGDETFLPLREVWGAAPDVFCRLLVPRTVKTHRETLAFEIAAESGDLPADFDPDAVSPSCFSGDPRSPLRTAALGVATREQSSGSSGLDEIVGLEEGLLGSPIPRTNVVSFLASLRTEHPALFAPVAEELRDLAEDEQAPIAARKAAYVRDGLAATDEP